VYDSCCQQRLHSEPGCNPFDSQIKIVKGTILIASRIFDSCTVANGYLTIK
jgi:hypothetical protein